MDFPSSLWPFRNRRPTQAPAAPPRTIARNLVTDYNDVHLTEGHLSNLIPAECLSPVPFPASIIQIPDLKHHGLRALCGAMMERHSKCSMGHPFCFDPDESPDDPVLFIAEVGFQRVSADPDNFVIANYLSRAESRITEPENPVHPFDYAVSLTFAGTVPETMMTVQMLPGGNYFVRYGAIFDPIPGDYSTGTIDPANWCTLYCDPEPPHAKITYWPSEITEGQQVVPRFRCMMLRGEWWIVDCDDGRGMGQQVAGIEVSDHPDHPLRQMPYQRG